MQSYIESIYYIPHTLAQLVDCGIYDFPLIILTASLMRVLRTGPLPLSFYALDLSQLSNIAICQKRSRSFPAAAICMRTRQHGVPTHSFVFTRLRSFHFHFPFWIFDSIRFDSIRFSTILNYPHWMFDRCPPSAALETFRAFLFVICFQFPSIYINIPDSLPIRFIDYLTFGTAAEQTDILLYLCILCCIFLDI